MKKSIVIIALIILPSYSSAEEVTIPAIDGIVIELGNYVQQVKIRVQSIGPGFCAVEYNLGDDTLGILAPPLVWTDWMPFETAFLSPTSVKFSENTICATGALAELQYQK